MKRPIALAILMPMLPLLLANCAGRRPAPPQSPPASGVAEGLASWYGIEERGRPTASGEPMDPEGLTAAHRTLPFGTLVRVTHLSNGRSVMVTVNDRGPFVPNRIIDLSHGAARSLDMLREGVARVRVELMSGPASFDTELRYRVQVGSFLQEALARAKADALEKEGYYPVQISPFRRGNSRYYRVWLGIYEDRALADDVARRLRGDGHPALVMESTT